MNSILHFPAKFMFGLLNIDKPAGRTSRDVVNGVQAEVRPDKVGHAGTLDPLATGVLILCVGKATRLIEYVQRMPKRYRGTFRFGVTSDTEDIDGQLVEVDTDVRPARTDLARVLNQFVGMVEQVPPAFSALKVKGQRAYHLARRGVQVELPPRTVAIHELQLLDYEFPHFTLGISCGSGTYVRSLGRDIAEALGTGAVMTALQRTAVGPFVVEQALDPDGLDRDSIFRNLEPALRAVPDLPVLRVSADETERIWRGQAIANRLPAEAKEVAACDATGNLVAILAPRDAELQPVRNFPDR